MNGPAPLLNPEAMARACWSQALVTLSGALGCGSFVSTETSDTPVHVD